LRRQSCKQPSSSRCGSTQCGIVVNKLSLSSTAGQLQCCLQTIRCCLQTVVACKQRNRHCYAIPATCEGCILPNASLEWDAVGGGMWRGGMPVQLSVQLPLVRVCAHRKR
jgi:hypothetical protein